jgi:RimJ/RimL family protein N-acetyltransferase
MTHGRSEVRLQTPRLVLRPPEVRDVDQLASLLNDFEVSRMTGRIPHPYARNDAEAFVESAVALPISEGINLVIETEEIGLVGGLGFFLGSDRSAEVGYWIGRDFWGRGLASEALECALLWAATEWGRRWVRARHYQDNPASGQVLIKAGFLYTGQRPQLPSIARGEDATGRDMVWLA